MASVERSVATCTLVVSAFLMVIHVVQTTTAGHLNGDVSQSELQSDVLNQTQRSMLMVLLQCGDHLHCLSV